MGVLRKLTAGSAAAILALALWASPAGAQGVFAIPPQAQLDAMSAEEKVAMERELTAGAADWPLSEVDERVMQPEMGVWDPSRGGAFEGTDSLHWAEGRALLANDDDAGEGIVRLEDFAVPNGPGLHVYLVVAEAPASPEDVSAGFVDLGPLKANRGNYNYVFPGRVDRYRSVVIYSKPFDVIFAVAPMSRGGV